MSEQDEQAEQAVGAFTIEAPPRPSGPGIPAAPEPDYPPWTLPGGIAHVFRGRGSTGRITRPVIVSDGFGQGASDMKKLHDHLNGPDFSLVKELYRRGHDLILLGYKERSASLLTNAQVVIDCIKRAQNEQSGDARMVVGGFSMGGLVTRYALASMESQRIDHRTAVYFSFDSPHRGAVIPIGLQAFAHLIGRNPRYNEFARQMNSPAARQMLWRHYDPQTEKSGVDPERLAFLKALEKVGGWPRGPRLLGLANGHGDGSGLPIPPGNVILRASKSGLKATFFAQARGKKVVVATFSVAGVEKTITTDDFPELDGAPGGTSDAFDTIAKRLGDAGATVDLYHPAVCFIPTVSAVAIRDIDKQEDLYATVDKLPPEESELHEFTCSTGPVTGHTAVTKELGTWLLDRLPD